MPPILSVLFVLIPSVLTVVVTIYLFAPEQWESFIKILETYLPSIGGGSGSDGDGSGGGQPLPLNLAPSSLVLMDVTYVKGMQSPGKVSEVIPNVTTGLYCANLLKYRTSAVGANWNSATNACSIITDNDIGVPEDNSVMTMIIPRPDGLVSQWAVNEQTRLLGTIQCSNVFANTAYALAACSNMPNCGGISYAFNPVTNNPYGCLMYASNTTVPSVNVATYTGAKISAPKTAYTNSGYRWDSGLTPASSATPLATYTNQSLYDCGTKQPTTASLGIHDTASGSCTYYRQWDVAAVTDTTASTVISGMAPAKYSKNWQAVTNTNVTGDATLTAGNGTYMSVENAKLACANEFSCNGFVTDASGIVTFKTGTASTTSAVGYTLYKPVPSFYTSYNTLPTSSINFTWGDTGSIYYLAQLRCVDYRGNNLIADLGTGNPTTSSLSGPLASIFMFTTPYVAQWITRPSGSSFAINFSPAQPVYQISFVLFTDKPYASANNVGLRVTDINGKLFSPNSVSAPPASATSGGSVQVHYYPTIDPTRFYYNGNKPATAMNLFTQGTMATNSIFGPFTPTLRVGNNPWWYWWAMQRLDGTGWQIIATSRHAFNDFPFEFVIMYDPTATSDASTYTFSSVNAAVTWATTSYTTNPVNKAYQPYFGTVNAAYLIQFSDDPSVDYFYGLGLPSSELYPSGGGGNFQYR